MVKSFSYQILKKSHNARLGEIETQRGVIKTPAFMPVGTQATVKGLYANQVRDTGSDIILGNTYHLMLRPSAERVYNLGGLHNFMNWQYPILTDSGGYQVYSLSKLRKLNEEGVTFQSHISGEKYFLSPERSIEIQQLLGSDIHMVLDECTPYPCDYSDAKKSMELSLRWAERCKKYSDKNHITIPNSNVNCQSALFGIVQGSIYEDLRKLSAKNLIEMEFDGMAIGGLAVGEGQENMIKVLDFTMPELEEHKPRYLMGVGNPDDILEAVNLGIDMFDCVIPTRAGRHGLAYTSKGRINIRNSKYADDNSPLDETINCPASNSYSKAYIHHLFKAKELLGQMLLSWSNIAFYQSFMKEIRASIKDDKFTEFYVESKELWQKAKN